MAGRYMTYNEEASGIIVMGSKSEWEAFREEGWTCDAVDKEVIRRVTLSLVFKTV